MHGERRAAAAAVVHLDAEIAEGGEKPGVGPLVQAGVAVEAHRALGERGHRWQETQDRAGQARVDLGRAPQRAGRDQQVLAVLVDADAESTQGRGHEVGVAGAQWPDQPAGAVGERGQHQRAGGQRLGAGQRDHGVDRR